MGLAEYMIVAQGDAGVSCTMETLTIATQLRRLRLRQQ
jgi:hypothetical protein